MVHDGKIMSRINQKNFGYTLVIMGKIPRTLTSKIYNSLNGFMSVLPVLTLSSYEVD